MVDSQSIPVGLQILPILQNFIYFCPPMLNHKLCLYVFIIYLDKKATGFSAGASTYWRLL